MTLASVLVQWWSLTAVVALVGGVALDLAVLPRSLADVAGARRRLARWIVAWAVMVLLAGGATLVVRAGVMAGGRLDLAVRALPAVLTRTHFGTIWLVRLAAALAFVLVWPRPLRAARAAGALLVLAIALSTSLTGHAADAGDLTLSVLADGVHVVASAAWVGGLLALAAVVLRPADAWPCRITANVGRRFSRLAGLCLALVVLTGGYNAWTEVPSRAALVTTVYGRALIGKIVVVLAIAALGALNRFRVLPALSATDAPAAPAPRRLVAYVTREALLGIVVLACTAVLTESTPARHAAHAAHRTAERREAYRLTMEELHESGGVPPGWIFRPPEGDAARGRAIFARLECYACHTVRDESFPPPSRPGPDLTGMGEHHPPGYLAESVMNPNAVIVEGPGYTGPDGSSIMPDYRDTLTVADLDDLVAYLASLD